MEILIYQTQSLHVMSLATVSLTCMANMQNTHSLEVKKNMKSTDSKRAAVQPQEIQKESLSNMLMKELIKSTQVSE